MKAVVLHHPGSSGQLTYSDFPDPPGLAQGEVLVRVKACGVNHLDIWIRNGITAYGTVYPHILGSDISGVVECSGPGAEPYPAGTPVIISPQLGCFQCHYCLSGFDNRCRQAKIIGASRHGGYAEFVKIDSRYLIHAPSGLSFEEAAAYPLNFLTSWHMLVTRGGLKPGMSLLILGGGSGIGSAAIQISRLAGATVIATAGSEERGKQSLDLGAEYFINHETEQIDKRVRELTGGDGVDMVFEHIGPRTWRQSLASLKKGGVLVTCGSTTGPTVETDLRFIFSRHLSILGSSIGTRSELIALTRLMEEKKLHPVIHKIFPLGEASRAHDLMESRNFFGKLILVPS